MTIKKFFLLLQMGVFGLLVTPSAVNARSASATGIVTVAITVVPSCTVSATGLNFGAYSMLKVDATSNVTVTCTNGTSWAIRLGAGSGAYSNRKLTSGSNTLNYNLYTSSLNLQVWGDGSGGTGVVSGTGTGLPQARTVFGTIPALQPALYGTYTDNISVVVSFS